MAKNSLANIPLKSPLRLAICSWAKGIGGGAARMESAYYKYYDRDVIDPHFISLIKRSSEDQSYDSNMPFTMLDQSARFGHLCSYLTEHKIQAVQFQGSFDPLVCEAARVTSIPVLLEVLHNIEPGGLFKNIDHIVCVSNAVAEVQVTTINYSTIHNGISVEEFPYNEFKPDSEKIILLQVARRSKSKINLDDLASDLNEKFPKLEFIICGNEHHRESTDKIKIKGVVKDIQELYRDCDFLVQLSDNEPFGLVAIEAMSSGLPVILSNSGGFREIVTDRVDGYLVNDISTFNAVQVISEAIKDRNTEKYQAIRLKAREKVKDKFRIEDCVKNYQDLILNLYSKKSPTRSGHAIVPMGITQIPPDALVGEALYDFHNQNVLGIAEKLSMLASSMFPLTQIQSLKAAHEFALYLKLRSPELYPKGVFSYLFFSGDATPETLNYCLEEVDCIRDRGLVDDLKKLLG